MPRALPISYSITHMECAAGSVRRFQFLSSNYRMASEANPSHNFPFADNSRVILSRRNEYVGSGWVAYGSRACEAVPRRSDRSVDSTAEAVQRRPSCDGRVRAQNQHR